MNKITVKISAVDKKKLNLRSKEIDFVDLERLIRLSMARENLKKLVAIARKTGLSKMTSKEIDAEIKAYRESAKAGS
jgi:hypothetical protein